MEEPKGDHMLKRRDFLRKCGHAATLLPGAAASGALPEAPDPRLYHEPARDVPIEEPVDVVVCGAGPAGVSAAIAAGRMGAKVRLIDVNGCLGGIWTAGLLCWILDAQDKPGLMRELTERLDARGALFRATKLAYDPEVMKLLLEELCLDAGVKIRLHTRVVAAVRDDSNRLSLAVTESKSGRQAFGGSVFVDATGDGDLAALAGCGFDMGRPETGEVQPLSMIVLLTGVTREGIGPFVCGLPESESHAKAKKRLFDEMARAGIEPSYAHPSIFHIRDDFYCMMANHEYGVLATDADALTQATIRARAEVHSLVNHLKALGGPWKDMQLVASPEHIGIREGRRIHGRYTITAQDLIRGATHEDAVCKVRFPIDVHSTDPRQNRAIMDESVRAKPYDIPFRALLARDIDGLLLAGRCISGDFIAHSSYRVTGNAVPMGEAAGVAAALASKQRRLPQTLDWPTIAESIAALPRS